MKTRDFIKLLQKEDPSGEGYIRINSDPIWFVEQKEGYWDGPYNYLEKDKNNNYTWIASTNGHKIDIRTMDLFEFAEQYNGNWEEMKKHIRIEYAYLDNKKRENEFMKIAEKECKEYKSIQNQLYKESYNKMIKNAKKGWTWFQDKKVDNNEKPNLHKYYTWKIYNKKEKIQGSSIKNTESIMKSGKWKKIDNKKKTGYYEWIYIDI